MKTISLSVSENDYEAFRAESARTGKSIASLIREAMVRYRDERIGSVRRLDRVTPFPGVRPRGGG
ncbi:MAG: ribbon-helix-helix protein, CopG family [Solirubrobacterales bacterium]